MSANGRTHTAIQTAPAFVGPRPSARAQTSEYAVYHAILLALSLGVLAAACLLQVRSDQRVALSRFPDWPFPETCQSKVTFGVPCPGCGLTRSFVHLAHGDMAASLTVHPIGWLVALFVAAQIPYRLVALRSRTSAPLGERAPWIIAFALLLLLIAVWIARLVL